MSSAASSRPRPLTDSPDSDGRRGEHVVERRAVDVHHHRPVPEDSRDRGADASRGPSWRSSSSRTSAVRSNIFLSGEIVGRAVTGLCGVRGRDTIDFYRRACPNAEAAISRRIRSNAAEPPPPTRSRNTMTSWPSRRTSRSSVVAAACPSTSGPPPPTPRGRSPLPSGDAARRSALAGDDRGRLRRAEPARRPSGVTCVGGTAPARLGARECGYRGPRPAPAGRRPHQPSGALLRPPPTSSAGPSPPRRAGGPGPGRVTRRPRPSRASDSDGAGRSPSF